MNPWESSILVSVTEKPNEHCGNGAMDDDWLNIGPPG